jgi:integrase
VDVAIDYLEIWQAPVGEQLRPLDVPVFLPYAKQGDPVIYFGVPPQPSACLETAPFVFTSERGAPFTTAGFARMIERAGIEAKFGFKVHAHMLRHACGYALANRGHDTRALQAYLGHKNIQHTVRYTELSPTRFKNFWRE